jgi:hypothetical protein
MTRAAMLFLFIFLVTGWDSDTPARSAELRDLLADNAALAYWPAFAMLPDLEDAEQAALRKAVHEFGPINDRLTRLVRANQNALSEMYRGTRCSHCVWGTAFEQGPNALLSHLSQARELARFSCLRSRVRFEQSRHADAVEDLTATMMLARHIGSDEILISLLVRIAIEDTAIDIAARYLPALDTGAVDQLAEGIKALPPGKNLSDAVGMEKTLMLEWFIDKLSQPGGKEELLKLFPDQKDSNFIALTRLSQQELRQAAIKLRPVYDRLRELATRSPDALDDQAGAIGEDLRGATRTIGGLLLPGVVRSRRAEAVHQARQAMLQAAIAVVRDGKEALGESLHRDPFGNGPFTYTKVQGGFEIQSQLVDQEGEPVTLTVGRKSSS